MLARENPRYFRVFRSGSRLYKEIEIFRGCLVPCKFGANIIAGFAFDLCAFLGGKAKKCVNLIGECRVVVGGNEVATFANAFGKRVNGKDNRGGAVVHAFELRDAKALHIVGIGHVGHNEQIGLSSDCAQFFIAEIAEQHAVLQLVFFPNIANARRIGARAADDEFDVRIEQGQTAFQKLGDAFSGDLPAEVEEDFVAPESNAALGFKPRFEGTAPRFGNAGRVDAEIDDGDFFRGHARVHGDFFGVLADDSHLVARRDPIAHQAAQYPIGVCHFQAVNGHDKPRVRNRPQKWRDRTDHAVGKINNIHAPKEDEKKRNEKGVWHKPEEVQERAFAQRDQFDRAFFFEAAMEVVTVRFYAAHAGRITPCEKEDANVVLRRHI